MGALKRLWTRIVSFSEAFDGIDDPVGDYIQSLGKRVDKLERELTNLESLLHSYIGRGTQQ